MDFLARWTLRSGGAVGATAPLIGSFLEQGRSRGELELFADCPMLREFPDVGAAGWAMAWLLAVSASFPRIRERDEFSLATIVGLGLWSCISLAALFAYGCPPVIAATGFLGALVCAGASLARRDVEAVAVACRLAWSIVLLILAAAQIEVVDLSRTPLSAGLLALGGLGVGTGELLAIRPPVPASPSLFAPRPSKKL